MLVKDGVIQKMFIEPEKEGDPFEVSDADTMLKHIDPKAKPPEPIVVFAKPGCPHCARAKSLLDEKGYDYDEITLGGHVTSKTLRGVTGAGTWPQVFISGKLVGNADDLQKYLESGVNHEGRSFRCRDHRRGHAGLRRTARRKLPVRPR